MACVVRLIPVTLILLSISALGLHFYLLKVRQNSTTSAGAQPLNVPWQLFSCFSQLTSYFRTAIKWIRRELHHVMSTIVRDWALFFLLRVAMLARDSIIYFIVIFGLYACIGRLLVLTSTVRYFLACLMIDILGNTGDINIAIVVTK